jgi:adenylate cyclase
MHLGPDAAAFGVSEEKKLAVKRWQWAAMAAMVVLILGAVAVWNFYFRLPSIEPASVDKMAFPLPDKPSIAVLPFVNMSDDPQQEYFVDGITNDIITALSEFKFLFIIASTSSFAYKGKPVKVQKVGEELGVRYVLEGSVQRTGDRMRINAQLIDATTGKHLWADRYDRDAQRLFDIQDEIVETIVATLAFEVDAVERKRVVRKGPENFDAYDYWLRGRDAYFRWTKEANAEAGALFKKAIELDPSWAKPYGNMAAVYINDSRNGWSENPEKSVELALEFAQKSYALDPNDYKAHWILGMVYLNMLDFDLAIAEYERALALNSNDADFLAEMARSLIALSRPEQAVSQLKKAMRMNPRHPSWYWNVLGEAYYEIGRYDEALAALKQNNKPWFSNHRSLAAVYVRLGRLEEARAEVSKLLQKNPYFTLKSVNHRPYKDESRRERLINDLRKAGVPE